MIILLNPNNWENLELWMVAFYVYKYLQLTGAEHTV